MLEAGDVPALRLDAVSLWLEDFEIFAGMQV
jgi:hypothetical protein